MTKTEVQMIEQEVLNRLDNCSRHEMESQYDAFKLDDCIDDVRDIFAKHGVSLDD